MKVVLPTTTPNNRKRLIVPPIPFERCADDLLTLQKHEYLTFKLRTTPAQADSPTYDRSVPFFDKGSCELYLITLRHLNELITGQHILQADGMYALARRIFKGDALATFNREALDAGDEMIAHFQTAIAGLTRHVFPHRAYAIQKRYMRRFLRKPLGVSIHDYAARVAEMNNYLPQFPPPHVGGPPVVPLDEEESKDMLEFSVPNSWQKGMVQHGFDPADHTLTEFIEFCEHFEYMEDHEWNSVGQRPKPQESGKGGSSCHAKSSLGGTQSSDRGYGYQIGGNRMNDHNNERKREYDPNAYCKNQQKKRRRTSRINRSSYRKRSRSSTEKASSR